ncbi:unnamed protein product [Merluccius merluccius]
MESQLCDIQHMLHSMNLRQQKFTVWTDAYYLCGKCRLLPKSEMYGIPIGCCYPAPPQAAVNGGCIPQAETHSNEQLEETEHKLKVEPQV